MLLIDEIDKADEEFEAFLLELLSDFQVSIPELGTVRAQERPVVVLTSNRARELSEALRRRCLHLFIDFPGVEQERRILELKVPELDASSPGRGSALRRLAAQARPDKPPSVAETLDWRARCCDWASRRSTSNAVRATLGLLLKHEDDRAKIESKVGALIPHPLSR